MDEEKKSEYISWRAAEYKYFQKSVGWYFAVFGVGAILLLIALWQRNFFFGVFILLAVGAVVTLGKKRPRVMEFSIDKTGVAVGKNLFYDFEDLKAFSVITYADRLNEIVLHRDSNIEPIIRIPIDSRMLPKVKKLLVKKLKEVEHEDSMLDMLSEIFKF